MEMSMVGLKSAKVANLTPLTAIGSLFCSWFFAFFEKDNTDIIDILK